MEAEAKNNGVSKKVAVALIIILFIAIIAVVGFWAVSKLQAKVVERKVDTIFAELKQGKMESLEKYLDYEEIAKELGDFGIDIDEQGDSENSEEEIKILFSNLDYKIISSEANLKNAKVVMDITNKDMGKLISNYIMKTVQMALQSAFTSGNFLDEELEEQLMQSLKDEMNSDKVGKVTNTLTIELQKQNGEWEIKTEGETIIKALLPGFIEKVKDINNSLGAFKDILPEEEEKEHNVDTNIMSEGVTTAL